MEGVDWKASEWIESRGQSNWMFLKTSGWINCIFQLMHVLRVEVSWLLKEGYGHSVALDGVQNFEDCTGRTCKSWNGNPTRSSAETEWSYEGTAAGKLDQRIYICLSIIAMGTIITCWQRRFWLFMFSRYGALNPSKGTWSIGGVCVELVGFMPH